MVRPHWYWSWRPAETLWSREFLSSSSNISQSCAFLGGESSGKSKHKREDERCFEEQGGGKGGGLSHCYQICATRVLVFKCKSGLSEKRSLIMFSLPQLGQHWGWCGHCLEGGVRNFEISKKGVDIIDTQQSITPAASVNHVASNMDKKK